MRMPGTYCCALLIKHHCCNTVRVARGAAVPAEADERALCMCLCVSQRRHGVSIGMSTRACVQECMCVTTETRPLDRLGQLGARVHVCTCARVHVCGPLGTGISMPVLWCFSRASISVPAEADERAVCKHVSSLMMRTAVHVCAVSAKRAVGADRACCFVLHCALTVSPHRPLCTSRA